MEYTLKDIADELKINKQRVIRFVKDNNIPVTIRGNRKTKYIDEKNKDKIVSYFEEEEKKKKDKPNYQAQIKELNEKIQELENKLSEKEKDLNGLSFKYGQLFAENKLMLESKELDQKLLEDKEKEIIEKNKELDSFKKTWFGLYRKEKNRG